MGACACRDREAEKARMKINQDNLKSIMENVKFSGQDVMEFRNIELGSFSWIINSIEHKPREIQFELSFKVFVQEESKVFADAITSLNQLEILRLIIIDAKLNKYPLDLLGQNLKNYENLRQLQINFEKNFLTSQCLSIFLKGVSTLVTLEKIHINLNENPIQNPVQVVRQLPKQSLLFIHIELRNCSISNHGLEEFGNQLGHIKFLQCLKISLQYNNFGEHGITGLMEGISRINLVKLNLFLNNNQLNDRTGYQIGLYLQKLQSLKHLDLDISNNRLNDTGGQFITQSIFFLNDLKQLELKMTHCGCGMNTIQKLGRSLGELNELKDPQIDINIYEENMLNEYYKYKACIKANSLSIATFQLYFPSSLRIQTDEFYNELVQESSL